MGEPSNPDKSKHSSSQSQSPTTSIPPTDRKMKFEPKTPMNLAPPKLDPIAADKLAKCNGIDSDLVYVAIKGKVFDVTNNKAYRPGGSYAGKDASRALALTSTKAEDVRSDWKDLDDSKKSTLDDWMIFFEKRYNIVGLVKPDETS